MKGGSYGRVWSVRLRGAAVVDLVGLPAAFDLDEVPPRCLRLRSLITFSTWGVRAVPRVGLKGRGGVAVGDEGMVVLVGQQLGGPPRALRPLGLTRRTTGRTACAWSPLNTGILVSATWATGSWAATARGH